MCAKLVEVVGVVESIFGERYRRMIIEDCNGRLRLIDKLLPPERPETKPCLRCGTPFRFIRINRKFCCNVCRIEYFRSRPLPQPRTPPYPGKKIGRPRKARVATEGQGE